MSLKRNEIKYLLSTLTKVNSEKSKSVIKKYILTSNFHMKFYSNSQIFLKLSQGLNLLYTLSLQFVTKKYASRSYFIIHLLYILQKEIRKTIKNYITFYRDNFQGHFLFCRSFHISRKIEICDSCLKFS